MEDADIPSAQPSPWKPMTNAGDIAAFGKLQEELGELMAVLGRCLIQGLDEIDPSSGKVNKNRLEEEIADVWTWLSQVEYRANLKFDRIQNRMQAKMIFGQKWLDALDGKKKS